MKIAEEILLEVHPNPGESKKDFIARFMSVTKDEYPDIKQRYAVCLNYWNRRKLKESALNKVYNYVKETNNSRKS